MIKIEICCGTNCYIMGSCELVTMNFNKNKGVELVGSTCLGLCKDSVKRPPYVRINNKVYSEVTPEKLQQIVLEVTNDL
ncbi:MAG: NAD(P)H-dependent oxidoreductase subunit E [Spirochaetales bacterium]|nr:NAD(P)H-dependent oxidoreductase subunit E [Spirochaetales bacterium]